MPDDLPQWMRAYADSGADPHTFVTGVLGVLPYGADNPEGADQCEEWQDEFLRGFYIGPDGKPALVNYRVRGTTYIVDRLFAAAELRLGTAPQRVVRIVRIDAVWRETQP